ncbi:MAG: AMIN domain-containing protein, partial [Polaromonas sp.]
MNKQTWGLEVEAMRGGLQGLLRSVLGCLSISVALAALPFAASAQTSNAIQAVTGSVQGGVEVIRIDLAEPLTAVPTGFSIQTPARIALDFPGISNAMGRSTVDLNVGNLRSANVVQAGDRSRVVLNLKAATAYKAEIQGKSLLITLDPVVVAAPSAATPPVFAENRNRDVVPLKDIDFRRGPDGSGRVVVD